jgi:hypothetical protein
MWQLLTPGMTPEHLGFLPYILLASDPRPIADQLEDRYQHGGGFAPYGQGKWAYDPKTHTLTYPDDEPMTPDAIFHPANPDETLYLYDHSIAAIVNTDGSFAVVRLD